jgi:hypothetical protein
VINCDNQIVINLVVILLLLLVDAVYLRNYVIKKTVINVIVVISSKSKVVYGFNIIFNLKMISSIR